MMQWCRLSWKIKAYVGIIQKVGKIQKQARSFTLSWKSFQAIELKVFQLVISNCIIYCWLILAMKYLINQPLLAGVSGKFSRQFFKNIFSWVFFRYQLVMKLNLKNFPEILLNQGLKCCKILSPTSI